MLKQKRFSSIKSIQRTIHYDYQSYRWFLYLVTRDSILETRPNLDIKTERQQLFTSLETQQLIYLLSLPVLALLSFFKAYILLWVFLPVFTSLFFLHLRKKQLTAQIATKLILNDFPDESYQNKTLYQIGEYYSRKENIPSLVDVIFRFDRTAGATIATVFCLFVVIFPSSEPCYIAACLAAYCLSVFVVNRFLFYRTLR